MISYTKFAASVSFFEFLQEEFYKSHFKIENYYDELATLKKPISVENLVINLKTHPKIFDITEEFFQLKRFTNTQYTHFLFDVGKLNLQDLEKMVRYFEVNIINFEDGTSNVVFDKFYKKHLVNDTIEYKAMAIKRSVVDYISYLLKKTNRSELYKHISNSVGARYRIANYLVENLYVDKHFGAIDLEKYLSLKRIPKDSKNIHGKFGMLKIKDVFSKNGIGCVDKLVLEKNILLSGVESVEVKSTKYSFVTERSIDGVIKRNSRKLKKFDFIILKNGIPEFCIETNFYSTTGSKIGINIGEYTILLEDIQNGNKKRDTAIKFIWITDGNHWLTLEGEKDFQNLKDNYFKEDWQLINFNLFSNGISNLLK